MTITAEQREQRRQWVGASDVAAICGLDPYRSAYDVWIEKVHRTEDFKSEPADMGDWLEGPLLGWAESQVGYDVELERAYNHATLPLAAHLDGIVFPDDGPRVIEAKTAGLCNPMFRAAEAGWLPDSPPERVIIQVHAQMMCVGDDCRTSYVAALVAGLGRMLYTVDRNDEWCDGIARRVESFWREVEERRAPDDTPSLDLCRRIVREPGKTVPVCPDLVTEYEASTALEKSAKRDRDTAKARLLAALGDADAGLFDREGERLMVTNYANRGGVRRLKIERNGNL
jgi:predicted phage-related endonuclease